MIEYKTISEQSFVFGIALSRGSKTNRVIIHFQVKIRIYNNSSSGKCH